MSQARSEYRGVWLPDALQGGPRDMGFVGRVLAAGPLLASAGMAFIALVLGLTSLALVAASFPAELSWLAASRPSESLAALVSVLATFFVPYIDGSGAQAMALVAAGLLALLAIVSGQAVLARQWRAHAPATGGPARGRHLASGVLVLAMGLLAFWAGGWIWGHAAVLPAFDDRPLLAALTLLVSGCVGASLLFYAGAPYFFRAWALVGMGCIAGLLGTALTFALAMVEVSAGANALFEHLLVLVAWTFGLALVLVLALHLVAELHLGGTSARKLADLSRAEQTSLGLALMQAVARERRSSRWVSTYQLAEAVGQDLGVTSEALLCLEAETLLVRSRARQQVTAWRLAESLDRLTVGEVLHAFGADLGASHGLVRPLAEQEERWSQMDLESYFVEQGLDIETNETGGQESESETKATKQTSSQAEAVAPQAQEPANPTPDTEANLVPQPIALPYFHSAQDSERAETYETAAPERAPSSDQALDPLPDSEVAEARDDFMAQRRYPAFVNPLRREPSAEWFKRKAARAERRVMDEMPEEDEALEALEEGNFEPADADVKAASQPVEAPELEAEQAPANGVETAVRVSVSPLPRPKPLRNLDRFHFGVRSNR